MSYLLHPSGGLAYHLRAWRWQHTLWAPFHARVRRWLTHWRPETAHLVLIGPSGGYALTAQFLERFKRIDVLEPDPLARWLLRRRFATCGLHCVDNRMLAQAGSFQHLATAYPDAAFLFCNLLGQELHGQAADFDRAAWLRELEPGLHGRAWASWHDIASTTRPPDHQPHLRLDKAKLLENIVAEFWQGGELELLDHATAGLCPQAAREYAIWRLAPRRYHLIEWLTNAHVTPAHA